MTTAPTAYRLAPHITFRLLGALMSVGGLGLIVCTVGTVTLNLPPTVLTVGLVLSLGLVIGGGLAVWRLPAVMSADETGYQVRFLRSAGVRVGRWRDVQDLTTGRVAGSDCVQLRLRDGTSTTIPVAMLAVDQEQFVRDLRSRLDACRGYRRL